MPTRRWVKAGYEFASKHPISEKDTAIEYVAAFLTPRAILLLLAPLDEPNQQLEYEYFRAVARSLRLE